MKNSAIDTNCLYKKEKAERFRPHSFEKKVRFGGGIPRVLVSRLAFNKMWHYVDLADKEVGWLGTVKVVGSDYLIEDVYLFKQEVGYTTTEITPEGLSEFAHSILTNHPNGMEIVNALRFWGHSHVRMETSPSSQDETQMQTFASSGHSWFLRGILNKLGKMEFSLFLYEAGIEIRDIEWLIYEPIDETMRDSIRSEFDEKVSEIRYNSGTFGTSIGGFSVYDNFTVISEKPKNKNPKPRRKK